MQVPASAILDAGEPLAAVNSDVIAAIHQHFGSTPEMCITDTGIDETLLSYMRAAVAPARQLQEAGWVPGAASSNDDAGLDTMAQLQDPVDFNTEAKVRCSAGLCSFGVSWGRKTQYVVMHPSWCRPQNTVYRDVRVAQTV